MIQTIKQNKISQNKIEELTNSDSPKYIFRARETFEYNRINQLEANRLQNYKQRKKSEK